MTSREKVLTRLDSTGIRREDEAAVPVNGVTVPLGIVWQRFAELQ